MTKVRVNPVFVPRSSCTGYAEIDTVISELLVVAVQVIRQIGNMP